MHARGDHVTDYDRYEPSFWVRSQVHGLGVRLTEERTRPCPHLTDSERDRYAYALWVPERLVCADCVEGVMDAPVGMCNRCGKAPAAHENRYPPTPEGDWLLMFRLCDDCQRSEMGQ
jgi:hypothetical protein